MTEVELWYDKYRPIALNQYVWPDEKLKDLVEEWISRGTIPSLMFAGGPGRGKTLLANLIIGSLGIEETDVLRLQGAKHNNADTIRNRVQEFCELGGWSGLRVVFFDEADLLSRTAQEMLRNVIDENSGTVRFIFTCNYPHRIIEALSTSRLYRIDIDKLPAEQFLERLVRILFGERVEVEGDEAIAVVTQIRDICYPDLRRAINTLQASVKDGRLTRLHGLKSETGVWENYLREIIIGRANPVAEICRIRELLISLTPDEMEDVYRFLYSNSVKLFGERQIKALYIMNDGQKVHRSALLPDMILLEIVIRLLALMQEK